MNFFTAGAGADYIVAENNDAGNLQPIEIGGTTKYINITETNVAAFATAALGYATALTPDSSVTATSTSVTIGGLDLGYYLVYPKGASGTAEGYASICSLNSTTPNATVVSKAVYPGATKSILENGNRVNVNERSVGDTITYVIDSSIPDTTGYEWYKMTFNDKLSKGLTFVKVTSVKIGSKTFSAAELDNFNDKNVFVSDYDETEGTTIRIALGDVIEKGYTTGSLIEIQYTAILNENAVIDGPNENEVDLEYTNDQQYTQAEPRPSSPR